MPLFTTEIGKKSSVQVRSVVAKRRFMPGEPYFTPPVLHQNSTPFCNYS